MVTLELLLGKSVWGDFEGHFDEGRFADLVGRASDDEEKLTTVVYELQRKGVSITIELEVVFQAALLVQTVPGPERLSFRSVYEASPEFAISALFDSASLLDEVLGRDGRESWNLTDKEVQEGIASAWEECQVSVAVNGDSYFRLDAMLPDVIQLGSVEFGDLVVDAASGALYRGTMRGHTVELSLIPLYQTTTTLKRLAVGREAKLISGYSSNPVSRARLLATRFIASVWEDFR